MSKTISTAHAAALTLASNLVERGTTAEATIQVANKLLAYMLEEAPPSAPAQQTSTPATATKPAATTTGKTPAVTPGKKAATKATPADKPAAPPEPPAEPEGEEAGIDYTSDDGKEEVGKLVSQLIAANRRPEAIALLAEYDATAVSGVKPDEREAFCNEARELIAAQPDITK